MNDWSRHWNLTQKAPLNHGSFGASPMAILDAKDALDREFNEDREEFLIRHGLAKTTAARQALADFVGADVDDLVIVDNATEGFKSLFTKDVIF